MAEIRWINKNKSCIEMALQELAEYDPAEDK